jgi:hypothetical protein
MDLLGDEMNAAPIEIGQAIQIRLRALSLGQSGDAASNAEPVQTILLAVSEVAPDLALRVAMEMGIELTTNIGTGA